MEQASGGVMALVPSLTRRRQGPAPERELLEVLGVNKGYGGRQALANVSLSVAPGAIVGVIGPNGAGKTTLLDVISGFATPEGGRVVFAGEDITSWPADRRARLGMSRRFRDARLFPTLTVNEVLAICVEQSGDGGSSSEHAVSSFRPGKRTRSVQEAVDGLVELMHLERYREAYVADLSTGTRRLVDLAAAIASSPQLLLLDEPAAGLAQAETDQLAPVLEQVRTRTGCAMVVIEHDIALVSRLADELMALHLGRVIARGRPDAVLEDGAVVAAYLGDAISAVPAGDAP
jgi:ABC-type branched-subunit amino acid transport system ATPase component